MNFCVPCSCLWAVGARIKFDRDEEKDNRTCEIIGTQNQIEYAKQLIYEKINEDNAFKKREKQTSDDKGKCFFCDCIAEN